MLVYKIDVIAALKEKGYSTYKLSKGLLPGSTVQSLRTGTPISWASIDKVCALLDCQPGDILEYRQ